MLTQRQNEIIEASIDLIFRKGIQGLTIKNLSKEIGISEPAIYRHYENKIDILNSILNFFHDNVREILQSEAHTTGNSISKLSNIFHLFIDRFSNEPQLLAVIFSEELFRNESTLSNRVASIMQQNIQMITSIVQTGQQNGEINNHFDAFYLSLIIMGALRLLAKQWRMSNYVFDLRKEGSALFETIKNLIEIKH